MCICGLPSIEDFGGFCGSYAHPFETIFGSDQRPSWMLWVFVFSEHLESSKLKSVRSIFSTSEFSYSKCQEMTHNSTAFAELRMSFLGKRGKRDSREIKWSFAIVSWILVPLLKWCHISSSIKQTHNTGKCVSWVSHNISLCSEHSNQDLSL